MIEWSEDKPNVFISYSWDGDAHKEWVKSLADILLDNGVNAILDDYDTEPGDRLPHFMEEAVSKADKVLVICTETYKRKADKREGGVGYEEHIISSELMKGNERKIIPILRNGKGNTSIPICLAGKKYIDLSKANKLNYSDVEDLILHGIYEQKSKPIVGNRPKEVKHYAKRENPEDIYIVGIVEDEVTAPRNDGTPGCALYCVPIRLSKRPSEIWKEYFVQTWRNPPSFTLMHRSRIASIQYDKIILDGTTLEEVQKYHRETLLLCVEIANKMEKEHIKRENEARERAQREEEERKRKVAEMASKIVF